MKGKCLITKKSFEYSALFHCSHGSKYQHPSMFTDNFRVFIFPQSTHLIWHLVLTNRNWIKIILYCCQVLPLLPLSASVICPLTSPPTPESNVWWSADTCHVAPLPSHSPDHPHSQDSSIIAATWLPEPSPSPLRLLTDAWCLNSCQFGKFSIDDQVAWVFTSNLIFNSCNFIAHCFTGQVQRNEITEQKKARINNSHE